MLNREDTKMMETAIKYYKMNLLTENDMKTIVAMTYSNAMEREINESIENIFLPFADKIFKDVINNYAK